MATVNDEGTKFILGPLSLYKCDGVSITRTRKGRYSVATYEARGDHPQFNPEIADLYNKNNSHGKGLKVHVYMTDDELEELFMAWQILKKGDE